jgi:hypothetical protein
MAFELGSFADEQLDVDYLTYLIDQQLVHSGSLHRRLWDYFRNPIVPVLLPGSRGANGRPYVQAQEEGLPPRITGMERVGGAQINLDRKEVVIENDIAWRVHTMIDFLFGQAPNIRSMAANPELAGCIERLVTTMFDANGGVSFFQELAMLGAVYGFVDVAFRIPAITPATGLPTARSVASTLPAEFTSASAQMPGTSAAEDLSGENVPQDPRGDRFKRYLERAMPSARSIILETVEAPRVLPILDENNFRQVRYWVQRLYKYPSRMENGPWSWRSFLGGGREQSPAVVEVVEIISPQWWQRYEDRVLTAEGVNGLGQLPVVHIQNMPLPLSYEGLSDVEPLIPLQDELNTRLSDRANRVTYQAFKMYLAKGIEDFLARPVSPGQMWSTQNTDATIQEFGSDNGSPSENAHIEQVRAAMDKVSAVPPLAAGLIGGNIGNLTSATALKVLLGGLLARTEKKRLAYGAGIGKIVELALTWMDKAGLFPTSPADRQIEIHWPNPLPTDEGEQLRNAQIKAQLGLPSERILAELGYDRGAGTHS